MQSEAAAGPPRGLRTAGVVAVLVAAGVAAAGLATRHHDETAAQGWSDAQAVPTVHLLTVAPGAAASPLVLPATTQAWVAAKLYARVNGYLRAWYKDIGAAVGAGTPLGRIDTPELDQQIASARAALASAQANARLARTTAARWNDLLSDNSVSKQEADEKNADLAVRTAAVQAARADLGRLLAEQGFATLRAPFAGTVTVRSADVGDLVGPGAAAQAPLFAVADTRRIRVYASVPQVYSAAIRPGAGATVAVPDYPGRRFAAQVTGNAQAINPQTGTFQVQLVVANPDGALKPGGYAQVTFDLPGRRGAVQIPSSTLVFRAAGTQVATVDRTGRVRMISVTIGRDLGQTVEITGGLRPGDHIVDNPPDSIAAGEPVHVTADHG